MQFLNIPATIIPNGLHLLNDKLFAMFGSSSISPDYEPTGNGNTYCFRARNYSIEAPGNEKHLWCTVDMPGWTITAIVQDKSIHNPSFISHLPEDEKLERIRKTSRIYSLVYNQEGVPVFKINVYKFREEGYDFARQSFEWIEQSRESISQ